MSLLRGALIEYGTDLIGPIPNVVIFQFNPESLTRTLEIPPRPTVATQRETAQAGEKTFEKITFKAHFSAANMLDEGKVLAELFGIGPQLAALEKMVLPSAKLAGLIGAALDAIGDALGGGDDAPAQPIPREKYPRILFIWGLTRVLPVTIDSMGITELEYDALLNPTRNEALRDLLGFFGPVEGHAWLTAPAREPAEQAEFLHGVSIERLVEYHATVTELTEQAGTRVLIPEDDDRTARLDDYTRVAFTAAPSSALCLWIRGNADPTGMTTHPKNVVFLTADAFGILPPISRLTGAQAQYHFISGYTAKLAGTEIGVTEPRATFSAGFGAPFLPRHPGEYARMLAERLERFDVPVWLVNTGWTGGPYGVGKRMELAHTRALLRAVLTGHLVAVPFAPDPVFGLAVPASCPGVPEHVLRPREVWADRSAYDQQAAKLAAMFRTEYRKYS